MISSSKVSYNNTNLKLEATNVQDALDEVYTKVTTPYDTNNNIVTAYKYDASKCITREETTCSVSTVKESCKVGTIIKYRVNDSEIKYFYVLHDL